MASLSDLPRKIGLLDATSVVVGAVIGSAIFIVPGTIARAVPSPALILAMWLLGGVITFCGALAYAELGAMLPATGGHYIYLREAYGPLWAFVSGWTLFIVIWTGGIAALAMGFTGYLGYFVPLTPARAQWTAVAVIALFTWLNYRGVKEAAITQTVFNALKLAGILILAAGAFQGGPAAAVAPGAHVTSWSQAATAMIGVMFAYEGWNGLSMIAGEVRNPQRNLPRSLALGTGICTAVYLLVNWATLHVLSIGEIAAADRAGVLVAERTLGPAGATLAALTILVAIASSTSSNVMTGPRVYFAQARDGYLFAWLGRVHPRFETPSASLVAQGVWSSLLVFSGSYDMLLSYAMIGAWILYGLTVGAVIVLRRKRPDLPRPYRMWGYPVTPVLFCLATLGLIMNTLVTQPGPAWGGLLLVASAVPLYYVWRRVVKQGGG